MSTNSGKPTFNIAMPCQHQEENSGAPELDVQSLLNSPIVTIRDTYCRGTCRGKSPEECAVTTRIVFPYRGVYIRHVGDDQAVADANQVLFFNGMEGYRISHPVPGGDASVTLILAESHLDELAPSSLLRDRSTLTFRSQRLRIDARAQALVALLRHSLRHKVAEPLEAEILALTLVRRSLGPAEKNNAILRDCTNGTGVASGISIDPIRVNLDRITRRMNFSVEADEHAAPARCGMRRYDRAV